MSLVFLAFVTAIVVSTELLLLCISVGTGQVRFYSRQKGEPNQNTKTDPTTHKVSNGGDSRLLPDLTERTNYSTVHSAADQGGETCETYETLPCWVVVSIITDGGSSEAGVKAAGESVPLRSAQPGKAQTQPARARTGMGKIEKGSASSLSAPRMKLWARLWTLPLAEHAMVLWR